MIERLQFPTPEPAGLPPQNLEAERAVLGSVLLDREAVGRVLEIVKPRDFYRDRHRVIFEAMVALYERQEPVDYLTLDGELADAAAMAEVVDLIGAVPTPLHAEAYATMVAECAVKRRLISAGGRIAALGFDGGMDASTMVEKAERLLIDVASQRVGAIDKPISEYVVEIMQDLIQAGEGQAVSDVAAPTGYGDLDRLLGGGLKRSDLVILAARPGVGKSTLAMNVASNAALRYGVSVAVFSLEMSGKQLTARVISAEAVVESARIRANTMHPGEEARLGDTLARLGDAPIRIAQTTSLTPSSLRAHVRRMSARQPLDLVVVDYIQLMSAGGRGGNRVEEVSEITRQLKTLALDEGVAVLALSQLSRAVEQRSPKIPMLSDLRESGSIEQDADVVMFIYRDDYYNRDSERRGLADVIVAKHRNGQLGQVTVGWDHRHTRFVDLDPPVQQDTMWQ